MPTDNVVTLPERRPPWLSQIVETMGEGTPRSYIFAAVTEDGVPCWFASAPWETDCLVLIGVLYKLQAYLAADDA